MQFCFHQNMFSIGIKSNITYFTSIFVISNFNNHMKILLNDMKYNTFILCI